MENAGGIKILLSSVSFDVITIAGTLFFSVALTLFNWNGWFSKLAPKQIILNLDLCLANQGGNCEVQYSFVKGCIEFCLHFFQPKNTL